MPVKISRQQSVKKYESAAFQRWLDWRDADKEPGLEEAKEILLTRFPDDPAITSKVKVEGSGRLDGNTSFLLWDLIENASQLFEYSGTYAFVNDLYAQVQAVISNCRAVLLLKDASGHIKKMTIPESVHRAGYGRVSTLSLTLEDREEVANRFISDSKLAIARWSRIKGVDWRFIAATLARLAKELRKEWRNYESQRRTRKKAA